MKHTNDIIDGFYVEPLGKHTASIEDALKLMGISTFSVENPVIEIPNGIEIEILSEVFEELKSFRCVVSDNKIHILGEYKEVPVEDFLELRPSTLDMFIEAYEQYYSRSWYVSSKKEAIAKSVKNAKNARIIRELPKHKREMLEQFRRNEEILNFELIEEFSKEIIAKPSEAQQYVLWYLTKGGVIYHSYGNNWYYLKPIFNSLNDCKINYRTVDKLLELGIIGRINEEEDRNYQLTKKVVDKFKVFLKKKGITGWDFVNIK